jgi:16S rRNA (guanine966-N2)-methyltransferase
MRVIAGEHRGRKLLAPAGRATRPTPERVREALFSALESRLGGPGSITGTRVLDLFAGSGALGIEALSRGARAAVFVERAAAALASLRGNLETLGLGARSRVVVSEAERAVEALGRAAERFDVVFVDPPYDTGEGARSLERLAHADLLRAGGIAVLEHPTREAGPEAGGLERERSRRYGSVSITFYSRGAGAGAAPPPRAGDAP